MEMVRDVSVRGDDEPVLDASRDLASVSSTCKHTQQAPIGEHPATGRLHTGKHRNCHFVEICMCRQTRAHRHRYYSQWNTHTAHTRATHAHSHIHTNTPSYMHCNKDSTQRQRHCTKHTTRKSTCTHAIVQHKNAASQISTSSKSVSESSLKNGFSSISELKAGSAA